MTNDGEFQRQVQQLGKLVPQFDELPDSDAKVAGKELIQLLMEVHGRGLERAMEIVFDAGDFAQGILAKMGQDPIVGNLLLLYSLHPDEFNTRVQRAVERIRPRLRKLSCTVELESVEAGVVRVRLSTSSHSCRSSTKDLRSIVEDGIYEFAPDVTSLEVLGPEEPTPTGFVTLESLMGERFAVVGTDGSFLQREGVD